MTKILISGIVSFVLGLALAILVITNPRDWATISGIQELLGLKDSEQSSSVGDRQLWTCGMHPEVLREQPGSCPICQMDLTPVQQNSPTTKPEIERKIKYWQAPMDPDYISDQPGKSPMGMDLIPVYEEEAAPPVGMVHIDPGFTQAIGVETVEVKRGSIPLKTRTVGNLVYNEQQAYNVTPKYEGWIEKAYVNYVGEPVEKGQRLFEVYSPQLVNTQKEFLQALEYSDSLSAQGYPEIAARAQALVESSRERLRYWDLTDEQIEALRKTREVGRTVSVYSNVSGVVVEKMGQALEGMFVRPGMNLLEIVDLSTIWLEAEVFESQISRVHVGQTAWIELPNLSSRRIRGTVRFLYPYLNETTRTLKVSIELPNPGQRLRAGMYADVNFHARAASNALVVPEQSVIRSGTRNVVVLALGDGAFQAREVELGESGEGLQEIRSGLVEGELVVVSSQFLIDSEANLQEAIRRITSGAQQQNPTTAGHRH
jgi:Cu(I)/Ag(I) efflux system membrane fusion protein/cobalt-zinc-cadmium efflux system membrane fusion protein